ncbi:MAG: FecR family protein [Saprospiraceae bacterium]
MKQDKYIDLIYRQWQGHLSIAEEEMLERWLSESNTHRQQAEEVRQSIELLGDYEPSFEVDVKADYKKLKSNLNLSTVSEKPRNKSTVISLSSRRKWMGIAATVTLLITASFLFWNLRSVPLEWLAIETKAGETQSITLEDGTHIWLNERTQLIYPKAFTGKTRPVKIKGEAFLDVAKNTDQPFEVTTKSADVKVLGTSFNVRAYEIEPTTTITVKSGRVQFSKTDESIVLTQNQEAVLHHESKQISHNKRADMNALAWQTNHLRFRNRSLTEVFEIMERHFKIEIKNTNSSLKDCKFTSPKEYNLESLFSKLNKLYQIEVITDGEADYIVKGGGC